jgi:hypothetical protein
MGKPQYVGEMGDTRYDDETQTTYLCLGDTEWVPDLPPEHGASEIVYRNT